MFPILVISYSYSIYIPVTSQSLVFIFECHGLEKSEGNSKKETRLQFLKKIILIYLVLKMKLDLEKILTINIWMFLVICSLANACWHYCGDKIKYRMLKKTWWNKNNKMLLSKNLYVNVTRFVKILMLNVYSMKQKVVGTCRISIVVWNKPLTIF